MEEGLSNLSGDPLDYFPTDNLKFYQSEGENLEPERILSTPHRLPHKFTPLIESDASSSNSRSQSSNHSRSMTIEKRVSVEVVLTEENLKDLMKCKPTEEWFSRAGKALKHLYPELNIAHQKELKVEQENLRKHQVGAAFLLLTSSSLSFHFPDPTT
jgi:hypothetical protein